MPRCRASKKKHASTAATHQRDRALRHEQKRIRRVIVRPLEIEPVAEKSVCEQQKFVLIEQIENAVQQQPDPAKKTQP